MSEIHRYALVDIATGHVLNVTLWDGNTATWQPPAGQEAILIPDDSPVYQWTENTPGWTYDGTEFHPPTVS